MTPMLALALVAAAPILRVGAARVEITPARDEALLLAGYASRKEGHKGIHDELFTRAIVVDDGARLAAIVTMDLIFAPNPLWEHVAERAARETGIAREHLLLAGTHTHGGPALSAPDGPFKEKQEAYVRRVEEAVAQALARAKGALQPARLGTANGHANVALNRRALMADGTWWLGVDPDGPSDKTVGVVRFDTLAGDPIAIFVNYGVHGTGMGQENFQITADVPGATSRWVEKHHGDKVVVPWTSGAAGDQNPIYRGTTSFDGVANVGRVLGEEVVRVAQRIKTVARGGIHGAQKVVTCPGRKLTDGPTNRRTQYEFVDAPPVDIRLSVLKLGDIAWAGVSGEVLTMIGQRLKKASRVPQTLMVTHCNGSSGYLPDDAAYARVSYEIVTTRVKPGCAEDAIVNGLLELMGGGRSPVAGRTPRRR